LLKDVAATSYAGEAFVAPIRKLINILTLVAGSDTVCILIVVYFDGTIRLRIAADSVGNGYIFLDDGNAS